ncbi:MAG: outer membrane lipoprotein chaperone LolA [Bryobacteraceae bacterium]
MRRTALGAILAALPVLAADSDISHLLKGIENRYNHAQTLRVGFSESYNLPGRASRTESGELVLRKPGKMRWQYNDPAGKLFVSDGKLIYSYSPDTNRAEKSKLKETEDMRVPLAFLLGKLDFKKDFRQFDAKPEGKDTFITALPKSNNFPYQQVAFLVTPDFEIRRLIVTGQDHSVLEFSFTGEKMNPPVNDKLFQFVPPPGAEYVDQTAQEAQE